MDRQIGSTLAATCIVLMFLLVGCEGGDAEPVVRDDGTDRQSISPDKVDASLDAAQQYLDGGKIAEAEVILAALIEKAPKQMAGFNMYGQLLVRQGIEAGSPEQARGFYERACEMYEKAVALEPQMAGLQQAAGEVALMAGRSDLALERFQTAGRFDSKNPKPPLYEAQVLLQAQRRAEARTAVNRVLALDPDEAQAHATLAAIELDEGAFDAALASIREARDINGTDLRFRVMEAKIHRRAGDPQSALNLLLPLPAEDRLDEAITFEIAESFGLLGQHRSAAAAWTHRCLSRPGDWKSALRAAEAYLAAGDRPEALAWQESARLVAPLEPEVIALEQLIRSGGQPDS